MPANQPTICGLCHDNPSKYKCPTCTVPYCSLICYKPHKLSHTLTLAPSLPPPLPSPVETPSIGAKHQFFPLLASPTFSAMLQSKTLQRHLLNIYHASLRPSKEEIKPRQGNSQNSGKFRGGGKGRGRGGRGRGRGGRGGIGDGSVTWTQEKGDRAALALLKRRRIDGSAQNMEVEEFVKFVVDTLDKD